MNFLTVNGRAHCFFKVITFKRITIHLKERQFLKSTFLQRLNRYPDKVGGKLSIWKVVSSVQKQVNVVVIVVEVAAGLTINKIPCSI